MSGVWEIPACWNPNGIIRAIGEVFGEADIHLLELFDCILGRLEAKQVAQVRQEYCIADFMVCRRGRAKKQGAGWAKM